MSLDTPTGSRGARQPGASSPIAKWVGRLMGRQHRRAGYKFQGMDVLFLTTTGRKSGQAHENPVSWFADGDDAWLIVASAGGSAANPAWYRNMAARPDQVWIELPDRKLQVTPEQLAGERREAAWQRITSAQPRYAKYQTKTDRPLPVIRLVPAGTADGTAAGTADATTAQTTDGTTAGATTAQTTDGTTAGTADETTVGTADTTAAGTAGATTTGTPEGTTTGTPDGTTAGTTDGTAAGTADATAAETPDGTTAGTTDGTADGTIHGTTDGTQPSPDAP